MAPNRYTATDKLLLAAYALEEDGRRPFTAEDLVVRAWELFPESFSLAGYRDSEGAMSYPDSNRVFMEIMGAKPIRKKGFMVKVGNKMYELTEAGRGVARTISGSGNRSAAPKSGLSREVKDQLRRLLDARATVKFKNGRKDDLTFHDACSFWGISPRSDAKQMRGKIANFLAIVESARAAVGDSTEAFDQSTAAFGSADLKVLIAVHDELQERFSEEIALIELRIDERL